MWERNGIIPPVSEARKMQQLLVSSGVPADAIIIEEESMDSIGNAYFLKRDIIRPNNFRKSLVLIADYIVDRARWCYAKIFEDTYKIDLLPTETPYTHDQAIVSAQAEMSKRERPFLAAMQKGDDDFWPKQGYNHPHYQEPRPPLVNKVGLGGDK